MSTRIDRIYSGAIALAARWLYWSQNRADLFRCVFAFGPINNPAGYEQKFLPFNIRIRK